MNLGCTINDNKFREGAIQPILVEKRDAAKCAFGNGATVIKIQRKTVYIRIPQL